MIERTWAAHLHVPLIFRVPKVGIWHRAAQIPSRPQKFKAERRRVAPLDLCQMLPDVFAEQRIRPALTATCLPILASGDVKLLALRGNLASVPLFARPQNDP